jgi:hypothetical protein
MKKIKLILTIISYPVSSKSVGYKESNEKSFFFISKGHPVTDNGSSVDVNHVSNTSSSIKLIYYLLNASKFIIEIYLKDSKKRINH